MKKSTPFSLLWAAVLVTLLQLSCRHEGEKAQVSLGAASFVADPGSMPSVPSKRSPAVEQDTSTPARTLTFQGISDPYSPGDYLFVLPSGIARGFGATIHYEVFGVGGESLSHSVNDEPAVGGNLQSLRPEWSTGSLTFPGSRFRCGKNTLRLRLRGSEDTLRYHVRNVRLTLDARAWASDKRLIVNQPGTRTCYGVYGYVEGYAYDRLGSADSVTVNGVGISLRGDRFQALLTRPSGTSPERSWTAELRAYYRDGSTMSETLSFTGSQPLHAVFPIEEERSRRTFEAGLSQAFTFTLGGLSLECDSTSLLRATPFEAMSLEKIDMALLPGGMKNLTGGSRGYRLLPHGAHFRTPARIRIAYDPRSLPPGYTPQDIYTYYYDETSRRWTPLVRADVDTGRCEIVSLTTHFTDFINGILQTPEMPETEAFVPTLMTDMQASHPLEGFTMIEAPSANSMGSANLNYPLQVPSGRGGLQPNLALQYNSNGGNGITGAGWDLALPCISVETRWGVPHYEASQESETYLLNGEQLVRGYDSALTFAHAWIPRTGASVTRFYPRVEESFDSIIRHGTRPSDYWWEVIDRQGTHYYYGSRPVGTSGKWLIDEAGRLRDAQGNTGKWYLSAVVDKNGNQMLYRYEKSLTNGVEITLSSILYSFDAKPQSYAYSVNFYYSEKPDKMFSGVLGVKEVTGKRLSAIETNYLKIERTLPANVEVGWDNTSKDVINTIQSMMIRRYLLQYGSNGFGNTVLTDIAEVNYREWMTICRQSAAAVFDSIHKGNPKKIKYHSFEYERLPSEVFSKAYTTVSTSLNGKASRGIFLYPPSPLGGVTTRNTDLNFSLMGGLGTQAWTKTLDLGGNINVPVWKDIQGDVSFVDLNGDGYPDVFYRKGSDLRCMLYRPLTRRYSPEINVRGLCGEIYSSIESLKNFGVFIHAKAFGAGVDLGYNWDSKTSTEKIYYADVNADGFTDVVINGVVYYNNTVGEQVSFTQSPVELEYVGGTCGGGYFNRSENPTPPNDSIYIPGYTSITETVHYPQDKTETLTVTRDTARVEGRKMLQVKLEAVRVWVAPRAGTVVIRAPFQQAPAYADARSECAAVDGITVTVQHNGTELYTRSCSATEHAVYPLSLTRNVAKGDRIYFRLQSGEDRTFDQVRWSPVITYNYVSIGISDYEGRGLYEYASAKSIHPWHTENFCMPSGGYASVTAGYRVSRPFSDTVYLNVYHKDSSRTAQAYKVKTIRILPGQTPSGNTDLFEIGMGQGQQLIFEALSKREVDWTKLTWKPRVRVVGFTDRSIPVYTTICGEDGAPCDTVYSIDTYISPTFSTYATHTIAETHAMDNHLDIDDPPMMNPRFTYLPQLQYPGNLLDGRTVRLVVRNSNGIISQKTGTGLFFKTNQTYFLSNSSQPYYYEMYVSGEMPSYSESIKAIALRLSIPYVVPISGGKPIPIGLKFESLQSHRDSVPNLPLMGPLCHQWGQFTYVADTLGKPIKERRLQQDKRLTQGVMETTLENNPQYHNTTMTLTQFADMTQRDGYNPAESPITGMRAEVASGVWVGYGNEVYISDSTVSNFNKTMEAEIAADPKQMEYILIDAQGPIPRPRAGAVIAAPLKKSFQEGNNFTLKGSIKLINDGEGDDTLANLSLGGSYTFGDIYSDAEFMDMNGDGYPDIVGPVSVHYTDSRGGLSRFTYGSAPEGILGIRTSRYNAKAGNGAYSGITPSFSRDHKKGRVCASGPAGGQLGDGSDKVKVMFMDVNGDGLPDKLYVNPQNRYMVALNLGYRYTAFEEWKGAGALMEGSSFNIGGTGISAELAAKPIDLNAFNFNQCSFSGGLGGSYSENANEIAYVDINGDGIPDRIKGNAVRFSKGFGYEGAVSANASHSLRGVTKSYNTTVNADLTLGVTIAWCKVQGAAGGVQGWSTSRTEQTLADMNGDGFPDLVRINSHKDELLVYENQLYTVGKLKKVSSFYGNEIRMTYQLAPYSPYANRIPVVMHTLVVKNKNGGDSLRYAFEYANYYHDKGERTAYGFEKVVTTQYNGNTPYRKTLHTYHNNTYRLRGKLFYELITDASGKKYTDQTRVYTMKTIAQGIRTTAANAHCFGPSFPALDSVRTRYYDPANSTVKITTLERYDHQGQGLVRVYYRDGDVSEASDNLSHTFSYYPSGAHYRKALVTGSILQSGTTVLRQRSAEYDSKANLTKLYVYASPTQKAECSYTYDGYGNVLTVTLPPNGSNQRNSYRYTYDTLLHMYRTKVEDLAFGDNSRTEYDLRLGRPLRVYSKNNDSTSYVYDDWGRVIAIRAPYEATSTNPTLTTLFWDDKGSRAQASSTSVFSTFSSKPIVTSIPVPRGPFCSAANYPWTRTDHYGPQHQSEPLELYLYVDGMARPAQTKKRMDIEGNVLYSVSRPPVYDNLGRPKTEYEPFTAGATLNCGFLIGNSPVAATLEYDVLDRKTKVSRPQGAVTTLAYGFANDANNRCRFRTAATDGNGNTSYVFTHPLGWQTQQTDPMGGSTFLGYDAMGALIRTIDPDGMETAYLYDRMGRKIQRLHPDAGTSTWSYDLCGNVTQYQTQQLLNEGAAIVYGYTYNRLTEVQYPKFPQNNVSYTYGTTPKTRGRVVTQTDGSGIQQFSYGKMGEIIQNIRTFAIPNDNTVYTFTMNFEYDSWNRMQQIIYPDGEKVSYGYDRGGNLTSVTGEKNGVSQSYITSIQYNKFGNKTYSAYGNGTYTTYEYDDLQRLSTLKSYTRSGAGMQNLVYDYDPVSNIKGMQNNAPPVNTMGGTYTCSYRYDPLNRLEVANITAAGGNYDLSMEYGPSGRVARKYDPSSNVHYGYCDKYRQHAVARMYDENTGYTTRIRWDENGNMVQTAYGKGGDPKEFRKLYWTEDNRLTTVLDPEHFGYYGYDAAGERYLKLTGTGFFMDINAKEETQGGAIVEQGVLYASPFLVATPQGYTKHYYAGDQRIGSKIGTGGFGSGFAGNNSTLSGNATDLFYYMTQEYIKNFDESESWQQETEDVEGNCYITSLSGAYESEMNTNVFAVPRIVSFAVELKASILGNLAGYATNQGPEREVYFFHSDHLGGASWITNASGAPVQHLRYAPFGDPLVNQRSSNYNERFTFTGKERDEETGYYYHGARFHWPAIGWISVDPLSDDYPGWTPYHYCHNNPINMIDPTGMSADWYENGSGQVVWDDNVTSQSSTPAGGTYIGKTDQSILNHYGFNYKPSEQSTNKIGFVFLDFDEGQYGAYHMTNVKSKTTLDIQANTGINVNARTESNKDGKVFNGITVTARNVGSNTGAVNGAIDAYGNLNVDYGGKEYSASLRAPSGRDQLRASGTSVTTANINFSPSTLSTSKILNSATVSGGWGIQTSARYTPVVLHGLLPFPRTYKHNWTFKH